VSDFYDHPDVYDVLLPARAEVPFYVDLARQQAGAVLELACGTGQLTIPIALCGLPTVGLDQSAAMLKVAKRRAAEVNAAVALVQGDMRDFALDREFDLIFIARNSLLHLLSTTDLHAAFSAVRRHLTPDVRMLARPSARRFPEERGVREPEFRAGRRSRSDGLAAPRRALRALAGPRRGRPITRHPTSSRRGYESQ